MNASLTYGPRLQLPIEQAYIMRWDEKCARESCTRISVCGGVGGVAGGGGGRYRCFNINDSIKIEKKKKKKKTGLVAIGSRNYGGV